VPPGLDPLLKDGRSMAKKRAAPKSEKAAKAAPAAKPRGGKVAKKKEVVQSKPMRLGIDFGTTHTVVALVDRGNYPIVSFEHADAVPSLVSLDPAGALRFGSAAPGWPVLRS